MEPEEEEGVLDTLTAVALYDYLAHAPDELTIAKGEVVMVLEEYDDGWWLVGNDNDDAGVVPSNYLSPFTTQGNDQTVDSLRGIEHVDAETAASSNMIDHGTLYKLTKVHDSSESSHHAYRSSDTIGSQNPEQQPKNASSHKQNKKRQVESKFDEAGRAETQVGRSEYVKLPDITSPQHSRESTEPLQLDHVSLERLTEEITSRVSHELSLRDQKLMEHVKDIIAQSVTPLPLNTEQQQLYRESSHSHAKVKPQREDCASNPSQDFPSKIPVRVALPKLVEPQAAAVSVSKLSRAPNLQGHKELVPGERGQDYGDAFVGDVVMPKRRPSIGDSKLPILLNRNARKSAGPDSEEEVSRPKDDAGSVGTENSRAANSDGIHYPQCRSVVYAPSCVVEAPPPQPSATLSLHHIYGYDGDFTRHGSNLHAKNILWADEERVIYPAAAVVVVQNVRDRRQGFFCGHSEDVTCVAIHPSVFSLWGKLD